MKKVRVTGVQILTPMRFLNTFSNFSKLISSLKAQVFNILKNHIDVQIFLLDTDFKNYAINKWFLHKFDIFINKGSRIKTMYHQLCRIYPPMTKLPDLTVRCESSGCQFSTRFYSSLTKMVKK
jgi:hypothetical protein